MIYLNGRLVKPEKAVISVFDHGFLYGDGIYETLRAYDGVVFRIDEHLDRLFDSASLIGMSIPASRTEIKNAVYRTMEANTLRDAYIRITISRGAGPIGLDPALCPEPTFVIMAKPFHPYPAAMYRKGVSLAVVSTRRNYAKALDPRIKSLNFLNNILAKREALASGAYEAVMLNYRGYLAEGTISNIFFVKNDELYTPSGETGILQGITREIILQCAESLDIPVHQGRFRPDHLYGADEVFISNTTMEVMPVRSVDESMPTVVPGTVTKALHKEYRKRVKNYIRQQNKQGKGKSI